MGRLRGRCDMLLNVNAHYKSSRSHYRLNISFTITFSIDWIQTFVVNDKEESGNFMVLQLFDAIGLDRNPTYKHSNLSSFRVSNRFS